MSNSLAYQWKVSDVYEHFETHSTQCNNGSKHFGPCATQCAMYANDIGLYTNSFWHDLKTQDHPNTKVIALLNIFRSCYQSVTQDVPGISVESHRFHMATADFKQTEFTIYYIPSTTYIRLALVYWLNITIVPVLVKLLYSIITWLLGCLARNCSGCPWRRDV